MSGLDLGPQRVCARCSELSPASGGSCDYCGAPFTSDLRWKVPVIVLMFVLAFVLALVLQLA